MNKKFHISIITLSLFFFFSVFLLAPFYVQAQETGVTVNFDVQPGIQPKILPLDGKLPIRLVATINLAHYGAYCGSNSISSFKWSVLVDFTGDTDISYLTKTASFQRTQAVFQTTINDTVVIQDVVNGRFNYSTYRLYALIECPDGKNITESSRVQVIAGTGQTIYTCVVPTATGFAYSCSSANLSNCSDVPRCAGRACFQIRTSLCGQAAPPSGGGGGGPPGGGGGPPGGGPPGAPQEIVFEIKPPTQVESLVDLAKAIGKFLFQIAIPIAVIIIIYAGILFLTSGGDKEKVGKARKALWYAVIGLTVILIGQGFFTLIKSILNLGGPPTP